MILLAIKFKKGDVDGVEKEMRERLCVLDRDAYPDDVMEKISIYENLNPYFYGIAFLFKICEQR